MRTAKPLSLALIALSMMLSPLRAGAELIQLAGDNGVIGINSSGNLVSKYKVDNQWQTQIIPSWGGKPVPGSLITGDLVGASGNVYGVNQYGQVFTTWANNGQITYALIPGTQGFDPFSLAVTDNGVFGTSLAGGLRRVYYGNGGWHVQEIDTRGGDLVPSSLVKGDLVGASANVYGVNEHGQVATTWATNGQILYALIPGTQGFHPHSLAVTDNGVFGTSLAGGLRRVYYGNGGWHVQEIDTWGGDLVPSSLVKGDLVGASANVYGVNEYGQVVTTWVNNGQISYTIIPGTQGFDPDSLAVTDNGVFGTSLAGGLRRVYYSSGWHVQNISTDGGDLIPWSLIKGDLVGTNANVYGINEYDQFATTRVIGGQISYTVIP
jgi:hypothetical protein